MTYQETINYLFNCLPMFQNIGTKAFTGKLDNISALCAYLGNPQNKFKSIHVAGTNGKGSTSHQLAAVLQSAGYKTGLYTSPHLKDFRERIKINGKVIDEQSVIDFTEKHKPYFTELNLSFFEMTTAMAFQYFAEENVDIAVIEVGLGGRLDSTNIINPVLSVITNISLDHTAILGSSLEAIAGEKAGIIKPNVPVVIGQYQSETAEVFIQKAKECGSKIRFASEEWEIDDIQNSLQYLSFNIKNKYNYLFFNDLELDLTGSYQLKNVKTVLTALDELRRLSYAIQENHIRVGLRNVKQQTGLMGRWQILAEKPLTVCDTGHNEDGIAQVVEQLKRLSYQNLHIVLGMVNDKDVRSVLALLPKDAAYYFCNAQQIRALKSEDLKAQAEGLALKGNAYSSVDEAFEAAKAKAFSEDVIFIGGSTFVVAEVL